MRSNFPHYVKELFNGDVINYIFLNDVVMDYEEINYFQQLLQQGLHSNNPQAKFLFSYETNNTTKTLKSLLDEGCTFALVELFKIYIQKNKLNLIYDLFEKYKLHDDHNFKIIAYRSMALFCQRQNNLALAEKIILEGLITINDHRLLALLHYSMANILYKYQQLNLDLIIKHLLIAAEIIPRAMIDLSLIYLVFRSNLLRQYKSLENALNCPQNIRLLENIDYYECKIINFLETAAEYNAKAYYHLGLLYESKKQLAKSLQNFQMAAKKKYPPAIKHLAFLYIYGDPLIKKDFAISLSYFEQLDRREHPKVLIAKIEARVKILYAILKQNQHHLKSQIYVKMLLSLKKLMKNISSKNLIIFKNSIKDLAKTLNQHEYLKKQCINLGFSIFSLSILILCSYLTFDLSNLALAFISSFFLIKNANNFYVRKKFHDHTIKFFTKNTWDLEESIEITPDIAIQVNPYTGRR